MGEAGGWTESNKRTMSINKIHINNTTQLSLNERFTVMQSVGPKTPPALPRRVAPRRRTQSASSSALLHKAAPGVSLANRKLLEQLDKKHKMRAALKLKRRSMKAILPNRPRMRNRIGLRKGAANTAIRLTPSGRLSRSNSLTNIATMKADLVQSSTRRRSNSASSLAGRLGARRASIGSGGPTGQRRRLKRNNLVRTSSKQNLTRSSSTASLKRSNSRLGLSRSSSRVSLRRTNSKSNLRSSSTGPVARGLPRRRIARNAFRGGSARSRGGGGGPQRRNSVTGRLGVVKAPTARDRIRTLRVRGGGARRGRSTGRSRGQVMRRANLTASISNAAEIGNNVRRGRLTRPRGRGGNITQRGRSRSRSRGRTQQNSSRGNRSSSRGGRGRTRGKGGKLELKKEDLDKELDQYMATTRSEMDIL